MLLRRCLVSSFLANNVRTGFPAKAVINVRWLSSTDGEVTTKSKKAASHAVQPGTSGLDEFKAVRLNKLELIGKEQQHPFAYNYDQTHKASDLGAKYVDLPAGQELPDARVSIAGRIIARRTFGKLCFFQLQDESGSIQLYIDKSKLMGSFDSIKNLTDVGDIIGVKGNMKRSDKGELSVYVSDWTMLSKALMPLPDKFHGLVDPNLRYRLRHVDMIVNPEVRKVFRSRAFIVSSFRRLLDSMGYLEIETPILESQPGGAEARPFHTYHNSLDMNLTLRIATELHLKRMIVGGFERVYELGRIFRNEGLSTRHNPEFTTIEMYQAYADYSDMMSFTEQSIGSIAQELTGSKVLSYQGISIDLATPWRRISMHQIVKETCGVDFYPFSAACDAAAAQQAAINQVGLPKGLVMQFKTPGEVLNLVFEEKCESSLIQPTFITDHPIDISPLAKPHRSIPGLTERFELFIYGREHANGYSELTDPIDQRRRFEQQV